MKWCDKPNCTNCITNENMEYIGKATPSAEDKQFKDGSIENYRCKKCNANKRFPRYNHPIKILETKLGRCGEWANVFTCICIALGHDARIVCDWTDHVWTEF